MEATFTNKSAIEKKAIAIIAGKMGIDEKEIKLQSRFKDDLGMDSLDLIELVMEFEKEFDISIPDDDAEKISTVAEVVENIWIRQNKMTMTPIFEEVK